MSWQAAALMPVQPSDHDTAPVWASLGRPLSVDIAFALTDCRPLRVSDDWTKWGAGGIALGPAVWASADGGRQYMNQDSLVTSPDLADGLIRHPAILPMYCRQLH